MFQALLLHSALAPFLASFLSSAVAVGLVSIPMRRLDRQAHWSRVGNAFWPVRVAEGLALAWFAVFTVVVFTVIAGDAGLSPGPGRKVLTLIAVVVGCAAGCRLATSGLRVPESAKGGRLRDLTARWLLFPSVPCLLVLMVLTLDQGMNGRSAGAAVVILLILVVLYTGGAVRLLKFFGILRPASEDLQQMARSLASAENAPLRSVQIMNMGMANAFASSWTGDLLLTRATVNLMDREELQSVMTHEIGHLKEDRSYRWRRLITLPGLVAVGLMPAAASGGQPGVALGLAVTYVILRRLGVRLYRRLEIEADAFAGDRSGTGAGVYARALEKIHAAGLIPAVLPASHPYPSLYDRMLSAGVTPDFPRPSSPDRAAGILAALLAAAGFFMLWRGLNSLAEALLSRHG